MRNEIKIHRHNCITAHGSDTTKTLKGTNRATKTTRIKETITNKTKKAFRPMQIKCIEATSQPMCE